MEKDDSIASISLRIHEVKEKSGLNGLDFYKKVAPFSAVTDSVARNNVSAWGSQNNKKLPSVEECIAIAENFGVSLDWLLMGKGDSVAPGEGGGKFDDLTEKDIGQLLFVELPRRFECRYEDGYRVPASNGFLDDKVGGVALEINTSQYDTLSNCARAVTAFNASNIEKEFLNTAIEGAIGKLSSTKKIPVRNGANGVKSGVKEE